MSVAEIKQELTRLTNAERWELLEAIWGTLENKDEIPSPDWHKKELRLREEEIDSGKTKFVKWEDAKADIVRRTS
jgi:putative addiction module component (TIGR02574 family)